MFTLEDGTGIEDANAYAAVAFCDGYHEDRGNTAWAEATNTLKEQAIIKATGYIDTRWGMKFRGAPEFDAQALEFPRSSLYDRYGREVSGIPVKLAQATAEYALRALESTLLPDPTTDLTGGKVIRKTEIVGPIEETTEYAEGGQVRITKPYPAADLLLKEYMSFGGRLVRA